MNSSQDKNFDRRREQNRLAQRRFRERHNSQNKAAIFQSSALTSFDTPPYSGSSAFECLPQNLLHPHEGRDLYIDPILFSDVDLMSLDAVHGLDTCEALGAPSPLSSRAQSQHPPKETSAEPALAAGSGSGSGSGSPRAEMEGADSRGSGWLSPLHIAAQEGHDKIVRLLIQHNRDCNEKDSDSTTPLMLAVAGGYEDVVSTLLRHGARVSETDAQGRSALHWGVVHRHETLLQLLLDHCQGLSAPVNAYDANGRTPLHIAIAIGFEAGVQVLLRYGADVCLKACKMSLVAR